MCLKGGDEGVPEAVVGGGKSNKAGDGDRWSAIAGSVMQV